MKFNFFRRSRGCRFIDVPPLCFSFRSVKVDSRIMSLSVKPDGLVFKENPMVIALKSFSHVSINTFET